MAIKGGDLLHVGNSVLIERAQTAGPGQVNIPTEKIYELGNYQSIGTLFDTPDLSFSLDSLDASAAFESFLTNQDFGSMAGGTKIDLSLAGPIHVLSQFKPGKKATNAFDAVASVALPYLALESVSYRFGVRDKATQSATLRGDSIFYNPGSAFMQSFVGTNTANQACALTNDAYPYNGDVNDGTKYALAVCIRETGERLTFGSDYTETVTGAGAAKTVTVHIVAAVPTTSHIDIIYSSDTVANYPQNSHTVPSAARPAAIRGRDIEFFVGGVSLSDRWSSVQSVNFDWRVNLDKDEELGNSHYVAQDFDVPDVSGSVTLKPRDPAELMAKVRQACGITASTEVAGASQSPVQVPVTAVLHSPTDGTVIKTIQVPDARITVPNYSGQVQQKLTVTMNFSGDSGALDVYKGAKP